MERPLWCKRDALVARSSPRSSATIFALAPSDVSIRRSVQRFAHELAPLQVAMPAISHGGPNPLSVVLWVRAGLQRALLGADLESSRDVRVGWGAVLDASCVAGEQASLFKVPHHGSRNAHSELVWQKLLVGEPKAGITAFTRLRRPLPTSRDRDRIRRSAPDALLAGAGRRQWTSASEAQQLVAAATRDGIWVGDQRVGHIRYRSSSRRRDSSAWRVDPAGNVLPI